MSTCILNINVVCYAAQATPAGQFFALGKSGPAERPDIKRPSSPQPGVRKLIGVGAKRDVSVLGSSSLVAKKPKVVSQTFTPLGRQVLEAERRGSPAPTFSHAQTQLMAFEESAIDGEIGNSFVLFFISFLLILIQNKNHYM